MTLEEQQFKMTLEEQQNFIDNEFKMIDEKLKDVNLSENERQILLEQRAEYEEQSEELDEDNNNNNVSEDEENDIEYESVYFKYCFEDCKTIDEVLYCIDRLKDQFEQWKKEGHELTQPVDTGYCFIDKIYKENTDLNI